MFKDGRVVSLGGFTTSDNSLKINYFGQLVHHQESREEPLKKSYISYS
jgi:hypothetical protein